MQTPYFVYDAAIIRARSQELRDAFAQQNVKLHYAVKANDHPAVIAIAANAGIGACLVSQGEMKRALAGGMPAQNMLMNGVGKSEMDIRFALENGIGQLNVESLAELPEIARIANDMNKRVPICLRINPEIAATTHSHLATGRRTDKFGILVEDIPAAASIITDNPQLDWRGFSCHIGTQVHEIGELRDGYAFMVKLFETWRATNPQFDRLDLGGGFGVSYTGETYAKPSAYAALIGELCSGLMDSGVTIQLEPGRFIAAESGNLVTKILYVKDSGGTRFVVVDAAMNNLIRPALYGAYHPVSLARPSDAPAQDCTIVGPVCESGDVFGTQRPLPADVKAGDLLHIGFAGAYGAAMASQYNARDRLAEYLKEGADLKQIRRAMTAEEFDRLTLIS